jgi:Cu/Ag efflux pump CusA
MMRWVIASSLRLRFLFVALAGLMLCFGTVQLRDTPVDVYPIRSRLSDRRG